MENEEAKNADANGVNDDLIDSTEVESKPQVKSFQTSQMAQSADLKVYLEEVISNPFNNFCIDCKQNKTTHAIVWLGAYICGDCAKAIIDAQGGNQHCYIKDIFNEQWDDYQLKSLAYGGNQNLFNILKEYGIENGSLCANYNTPCLKWYRQSHQSKMDGVSFSKQKPPRNWDETIIQTQNMVVKNLNTNFNSSVKFIGNQTKNISETVQSGQALAQIKNTGQKTGAILTQQASSLRNSVTEGTAYAKVKGGTQVAAASLGAGAMSLKEKVQTQAFAQNLMGMFGQKKKQQAPSASSQDDKKDDAPEQTTAAESERQPQNQETAENK